MTKAQFKTKRFASKRFFSFIDWKPAIATRLLRKRSVSVCSLVVFTFCRKEQGVFRLSSTSSVFFFKDNFWLRDRQVSIDITNCIVLEAKLTDSGTPKHAFSPTHLLNWWYAFWNKMFFPLFEITRLNWRLFLLLVRAFHLNLPSAYIRYVYTKILMTRIQPLAAC